MRGMRLSQRCSWGLGSSGIQCPVVRRLVPDLSKTPSSFKMSETHHTRTRDPDDLNLQLLMTFVSFSPVYRGQELNEIEHIALDRMLISHHHHHHHHHLHPWVTSFDLVQNRRVAIVSWGVHDLFFLKVCNWGRVSEVWCCPSFQDGWSSFVCIWISRLAFQRSLVLFLWFHFLFLN